MTLISSFFGARPSDGPVAEALDAAIPVQTAGAWTPHDARAVGGLNAIGFARTHDTLLVTSSQGQSVIDATTGEAIFRNREDDGLDIDAMKGTRLDHPADERFDMAGLHGGGLRRSTGDGWTIDIIGRGADAYCVLQPPGASIHNLRPQLAAYNKDATFHLLAREKGTIVAFGFSWTGCTLALATTSHLSLWTRPAPLRLT